MAISADGTLYRRKTYSDLIITKERNGILEIVNSRGLILRDPRLQSLQPETCIAEV